MGFLTLLLFLCAGLVLRRRRLGRVLMVAAAVGLFLWSWPPVAARLSATLERRYPVQALPLGDAPAIVVLSGNLYPTDGAQVGALPGVGTYLRCHHAAWLYRNWKRVPILVSGGVPNANHSRDNLAAVMKIALEREGVPEDAIWMEGGSRSTYENAVYSARMLRGRGINRIVLVTEAIHMPRAAAAFRRQGLEVVPAPCAFRYVRFWWSWWNVVPDPSRMLLNEDVLHEWIGLAWYSMTGKV
jgi:uncharacterized SAM-binding protein YcdF (DUF218 family)